VGELDLRALPAAPAERVLLVQNVEGTHLDGLRAHLAGLGAQVAHEVVAADRPWIGQLGAAIALPPVAVLRRIADWIAESCA
jgi:hypothetical protein